MCPVKDERPREKLAGAEKNMFQSMLDQATDFIMNLLGMGNEKEANGGQTQILDKAKELAAGAIKGIVEGTDNLIKTFKLDDNDMVKKMQEQAKDYLKQLGLLEDNSFENEEYY
ncbi:MAG: hypothetical protein ACTSYS_08190 [Promethearchaeota archaeon]